MGKESYSLGAAKKVGDLDGAYKTAVTKAKAFDIDVKTALKEPVVSTEMTTKKKPADFFIEIEWGKGFMKLDFVCAVKGGGRWVLGRKMYDDVEEFLKNKALAKVVHQETVGAECGWDL